MFLKLYNMTYNEKKSLYESIMMETAKTVKRMINEAGVVSYSPLSEQPIQERLEQLPYIINKAQKEYPKAISVLLNVIDRFEEIIDQKNERWLREFSKAINPDWL